jgi:hypothetical protein
MSRGQRIGLLVAAVAIAVVAFVIVKPGSDDDSKGETTTQAASTNGKKDTSPPKPQVTRIALKGHKPVGGPKSITVKKGDRVRIVVTTDVADEVHLHGYDIEREVAPGKPGRFDFVAKLEGAFDMESHESEAKIAGLQVEPG